MSTIDSLEQLRALYGPARERSALKELDHMDVHALRLVGLSPMLVMATASADGAMDASPRGGAPGFVKTPDATTLLIPDAPGNNRLDSLQNIVQTGQVGLLFLVPGMDETLRINGRAVLSTDGDERALCADARREPTLVIRVSVQACYLHCAKALMRSALWDPTRHVDRSSLPSMGEMLRDQIAHRMGPDAVFETQEQMLERYRQSL